MTDAAWRQATAADLDAIVAIQACVHTLEPEDREVFASKLRACPEGCRILDRAGTALGYGICHPWRLHDAPALHAPALALPASPDCLFVHDVALLPAARGRGAARGFLAIATEIARDLGLGHLALVSVYRTAPVWARLGFAVTPLVLDDVKQAQYGDGACYMVADVTDQPRLRAGGAASAV